MAQLNPPKGAELAQVPRQLPFYLPVEARLGSEDFLVSPSNEIAWRVFERWPDWADPALTLIGPGGAGKSHLAAIWAVRAGARTLPARVLAEVDLPTLARAGALVLEDADHALAENSALEAPLFHLLNLARAAKACVVVTARAFPDQWRVGTADLLSRLRLAPVVEIRAPDDALVRAVLVKLFVDRQLTIDAGLIDYIAVRIERSLDAARAIVEALDHEGLALGRRVTRAMAGEVLRRMERDI